MVKRQKQEEETSEEKRERRRQEKRKKRRAEALAAAADEGTSEVAAAGNVENAVPASGRGQGAGRGRGTGEASGRGGRGHTEAWAAPGQQIASRPSALRMLRSRAGRAHTLSVALPSSIIDNCQSGVLKAVLAGQIARALTIFAVDEIIVYEDQSSAVQSKEAEGWSQAMAFMTRNLQYLETPQYLRKALVPMHGDLKWVGVLNPLDAPHHLRKKEWLAYREGVVLPAESAPWPLEKNMDGEAAGCWLDCGLDAPVWLAGHAIPDDTRVTVRMDEETQSGNPAYRGTPVSPHEPRTKMGLYWGYQTRLAKSLRAVFDECPFEGGYDMTIGTSERGEALGLSRLPKFRHLLLAFGGVGGFEDVIADEMSGYIAGTSASSLFTRYVNICPNQTSRTIRSEEALLMALTALSPHMPER